MAMPLLFLCCVFVLGRQVVGDPVVFENGVYNGLTISVDPSVPEDQCKDILTNLELSDQKVQQYLGYVAYSPQSTLSLSEHFSCVIALDSGIKAMAASKFCLAFIRPHFECTLHPSIFPFGRSSALTAPAYHSNPF
ncbi:hypothetical protein LSTR_LSTR000233 [Laodelphax striatellus]|uniref:Ground-like domain-containing protein n=1 Tax=Laodelphax striatellus TaxID=195883 RepID=A0A482X6K7_LAOST|nr:hypothetical protein LSTR_LSTR000233 [Laodelphax striatellus]